MTVEGFRISFDLDEMDFDAIHASIARSYWAEGIPRETLQRALEHSLCCGILTEDGLQVGFGRAVTDYATYAYLADVYVLEPYRGLGLSKWLMRDLLAHPRLQGLRRINLTTVDAHGLYTQFGFKPLAKPEVYLEVWRPDVYKGG